MKLPSCPGVRTVALPATVIPHLVQHLAEYVDADPDALVFTGPKGAPVRRGNFNQLVGWGRTVAEPGAAAEFEKAVVGADVEYLHGPAKSFGYGMRHPA